MKRDEIGSEFWNVPQSTEKADIFPEDTLWFLSGRNALLYIIRDAISRYGIRNVAIPDYACESMIIPFEIAGINVSYYHITPSESGLVNEAPDGFDAILVMDYFGYSSGINYSGYKGVVIRDLTHSLFGMNYGDATYYFGSLRKWCGVYTGGFAYMKGAGFLHEGNLVPANRDYVALRSTAMTKKASYIAGDNTDKEFLEYYQQAEEMLDTKIMTATNNLNIAADANDVEKASYIDVSAIRSIRKRNAGIILKELKDYAIYKEIADEDCPMFVPVLIKNRDEVRRFLIDEEIYCPVHWPISSLHPASIDRDNLYNKELSLVCDQRYNENHMDKLIFTLKKALKCV